jgi:hypothetical protein
MAVRLTGIERNDQTKQGGSVLFWGSAGSVCGLFCFAVSYDALEYEIGIRVMRGLRNIAYMSATTCGTVTIIIHSNRCIISKVLPEIY